MRHKIREQSEPSLISGLGHSEGARRCYSRHFEAHGVTITASRATPPPAYSLSTAFSLWSSVQFSVGTISPFPEAEKQTPPLLDVTCSVLCGEALLQTMKLEQRGPTRPRGHHFACGMGHARTHVRVHPTETGSI